MTPDEVKEIVDGNKVVIFMKGTRMFPQCRYSHRAVAVLNELKVPFKDVNIFDDPTIRPALVTHSGWKTTPQVFVGGELVGGSDICLEMYESGELQKLVAPLFEGSEAG